ncbi:MAG TPA: ABC transporter substrate-binding protein [Anaerolineae bacterium]|nr:ABC transporter substrate-binding protein [Anaerolineae bacterium]
MKGEETNMRTNKWQLLTVFLVLTLVASFAVACGATPEPEVIKETVVVTEKETVVVTEKETVVVTEKEEVEVTKEVVVTATPPAEPPAPEGPTGSVRFLIAENFWADWDPYQHTAQSQGRIEGQIFDYLVDFPDTSAPPVPMLATEWTRIDDRTWEFKLRDDVTFHDGSTFDGEDVKASIELASGATDTPTLAAGNWIPTNVEIVDPYTVRLVSEQPFAALFAQLRETIIVSADDLANNAEAIKTQPNGTGPFHLVQNEVTRKVMEANLDYWQGPPQIKTLIWEFIQDPDTRLAALMSGQADVIDRVPPQHLQILAGSENLELSSVTGIESVNLWVKPGRFPLWDENQAFREAVVRSIDREGLVTGLVQGGSAVATSFLPTKTLYHQAGDPAYTRDLETVRALLAEAGVPDGGPEFELWVASGFLPRADEVGAAIAASLQEAGLKPKIVTTDLGAMIDDIFSEDGTGQMYHLSWSSNGDPSPHAMVYSDKFAWYFGDEELQRLIDLVATTTDPVEREKATHELQAHMWNQVWHVPLYNSDFSIAHTKNLVGLDVRPNFETLFYPASITE